MAYEHGRLIVGWPGYKIEEDGTVWSTHNRALLPTRLAKLKGDRVTLSRPGQRKQFAVRKLVEDAFPRKENTSEAGDELV